MLAKYGCGGVSPTTTLTVTPLEAFVWSNCQQNGKFSRAFSGNSGEGLQTPPPVASEKSTLLLSICPQSQVALPGWGQLPPGRLARAEHGGQRQLLETSQAAAYRTEE